MITFDVYVNGVLTTPTSIKLSDPDSDYGVRRRDTLEIVVADGVDMTEVTTGKYEYSFTDPAPDLEYEYYVEYVVNGQTYHVYGTVFGEKATLTLDSNNSYATVDEADDYFATRIMSDAWDRSSETLKKKALITATRYIDRLNFIDQKYDPNQILEFPRTDDVDVPNDIVIACCEIAYSLLDGADIDKEYMALFVQATGYGQVKTNYDRTSNPSHILAGIPSVIAWRYLLPYLRDYSTIVLRRTS